MGWRTDKHGNHFQQRLHSGKITDEFGRRVDPRKMIVIDENKVHQDIVDEIKPWTDNNANFHEHVINPNVKNIAKRMEKNKFKAEYLLHKKSFLDGIGREAIDNYKKGAYAEHMGPINADTRRKIGEEFAEDIIEQAGYYNKRDRPKSKAQENLNYPLAQEHIRRHMENL